MFGEGQHSGRRHRLKKYWINREIRRSTESERIDHEANVDDSDGGQKRRIDDLEIQTDDAEQKQKFSESPSLISEGNALSLPHTPIPSVQTANDATYIHPENVDGSNRIVAVPTPAMSDESRRIDAISAPLVSGESSRTAAVSAPGMSDANGTSTVDAGSASGNTYPTREAEPSRAQMPTMSHVRSNCHCMYCLQWKSLRSQFMAFVKINKRMPCDTAYEKTLLEWYLTCQLYMRLGSLDPEIEKVFIYVTGWIDGILYQAIKTS